jgi:hypothetical protein
MKERRQFPRQKVLKGARVLFDAGKPVLNCIVLDLSNHGAGIQLAPDLNIYAPMLFELTFDNFRSTRQCRLAWQHNDKLGVCFF